MSDRGDLQDVQEFVKVIISSLRIERDAIGETDAVGGILPNGINDVYLKVTLHDVSVEFEISSARAIHNSEPCTGIRRDIHVPPGGGAP